MDCQPANNHVKLRVGEGKKLNVRKLKMQVGKITFAYVSHGDLKRRPGYIYAYDHFTNRRKRLCHETRASYHVQDKSILGRLN